MIWEETEGGVFVKISNPMPETLPAQGFGIGLDSLKKRCLFFFGSKSRVSVVNENGYFEVTVFLPRKTTT